MPKIIKIDFEAEHFNRTEIAAKRVQQIYLATIKEAAQIATSITNVDLSKPFSFADYPSTNARVKKLIATHYGMVSNVITNATLEEWNEACIKSAELVKAIAGKTKLLPEQIAKYENRNLEALSAFQKQKYNGLGLSDRVWNLSAQFKTDLEMGLDLGLGSGMSATDLSRELRGFLNNPDELFRRVRDKNGNLKLSKPAKAFHPGAGRYRSSYKNAMRLTRNTINEAYRESDHLQRQQLDFIVGFEVVRSNHVFACPICDALKGKYPKTFHFVSWHVQCRCHVLEILTTQEEFISKQKRLLSGLADIPSKSANEVTHLPDGFNKYMKENKEKIRRSSDRDTLPNFIKHNRNLGIIKSILTVK